ncbi:hypothetical protein FGO68_gene6796 [Halteria grandinella]|uniref:Uncharacterized protein n=1 Tax=Halteria grandinella TaxID=5974 RepID=A0A8J8P6N9_HALGN|nr:hypothetical protein FGO68_gene6796 [Halteria grandinella]
MRDHLGLALISLLLLALSVNLLKVLTMICIQLVKLVKRKCCTPRDRVTVLRASKYAATPALGVVEETKEEQKEELMGNQGTGKMEHWLYQKEEVPNDVGLVQVSKSAPNNNDVSVKEID